VDKHTFLKSYASLPDFVGRPVPTITPEDSSTKRPLEIDEPAGPSKKPRMVSAQNSPRKAEAVKVEEAEEKKEAVDLKAEPAECRLKELEGKQAVGSVDLYCKGGLYTWFDVSFIEI
jgi:hypothetical protein